MNGRVGTAVVRFVLDRRAGHGNLTRRDRRHRFGFRNVVVGQIAAVNDVLHVDGMLARVGAFEH